MKKIFLFSLFLLVAGVLYASSPFKILLGGNLTEIHPLVINNEIYLPLRETALLFHLKADVNIQDKKISLEPEGEETRTAPTSPAQLQGSVLGEALFHLDAVTEKPVAGLNVRIFKANLKYDENADRAAIQSWVEENDSFYFDTHGLVAQTTTDVSGRFAFSRIPPGSYEIVASVPISTAKTGYWWIPFRLEQGETRQITLNDRNKTIVNLRGSKSH